MNKRFKVLGVNDDQSFCMCCGRNSLQQVVWIEDTETGEVKHFGTTCANQPVKGFDVKKEIAEEVRIFKNRQQAIGFAARGLYKASGGQVINWNDAKFGPMSKPADMDHYTACVEAVKLQRAA
jgi:hypothetical protein